MGLILGYLLVCDPAEQTARALQEELDLSAGSVSSMVGMLVNAKLVTKLKKPKDRKFYYVIAKGSWQRTVEMRLESIKKVRNIASKGLQAADNYRMREIWEVYDIFAMELEHMIKSLRSRSGL
jgi:DNA-binding transcriptional regulator GbsR (MarR family)